MLAKVISWKCLNNSTFGDELLTFKSYITDISNPYGIIEAKIKSFAEDETLEISFRLEFLKDTYRLITNKYEEVEPTTFGKKLGFPNGYGSGIGNFLASQTTQINKNIGIITEIKNLISYWSQKLSEKYTQR